MFASPRAYPTPDGQGEPTEPPESKGENGHDRMEEVVFFHADEALGVAATRAVGPDAFFV